MPPNALRSLAERFLNTPDVHVNIIRLEPGPDGRCNVLIALDLVEVHHSLSTDRGEISFPSPGIWHYPTPLAGMLPNARRSLAGRYLNAPDVHVSTIQLERGPDGRFNVLIALEFPYIL
jgi:hypothetical protein